MASIETRTNSGGVVSHRVKYRDNGRLLTETFYDAKAALEFKGLVERIGPVEARKVRDARTDAARLAAAPTVADYIRDHVAGLTGVTDGTRRDYLSYVEHDIAPTALGYLPVNLVTRADVATWVNQLAERVAGKTIRNRHSLLSAAMAHAVDDGWRPDNPCRGLRLPRSVKREHTFLTHEEFALLLDCIPAHWHPLVLLLAGTGLRWGEATALQVGDLHLDDNRPSLTVSRAWKHTNGAQPELGPPKSAKSRRTVILPPQVVDALRPLLEGRKPADLVFLNRQGRVIRHHTFYEMTWQKAVKAANDPAAAERDGRKALGKTPRIHDLRHTHAAWLISAGVGLTVVQRRLGHESIQTTVDVYGHLTDDALEGAVEAATVALSLAAPELLAIEA